MWKHLFHKKTLMDKIKEVPMWWFGTVLPLALIGILDTLYLVSKQFSGVAVTCPFGATAGCNSVLTSQFSTLFGVKLSLLGLMYYVATLIFVLMFSASRKYVFSFILLVMSVCGFAFSFWLIYVQMFILNSFCYFCLLSALTSTLLFILNTVFLYYNPELKKIIANMEM